MKHRGIRIPARMREPLVGDRGDGRGTGRDLQDSSTPTAATRHISMPPATEETCHTAHMLRVCLSAATITSLVLPVLRLNSGLVRVQRCWRIAHATVAQGVSIAHPSHLLAGCCCDSLVVLPRLSCPRGEATAAIKHKRGPLEHTQGQAAGPTGHFTPPHPLVTSGATAGVRGTALCSLSLRAGR